MSAESNTEYLAAQLEGIARRIAAVPVQLEDARLCEQAAAALREKSGKQPLSPRMLRSAEEIYELLKDESVLPPSSLWLQVQ